MVSLSFFTKYFPLLISSRLSNAPASTSASRFFLFTCPKLFLSTKSYVDNVAGVSRTINANTNTSTGTSNVFFIGTSGAGLTQNYVELYVDGLRQNSNEYTYHAGNNTVQIADASLPSGLDITIYTWET